VPLGYQVDIQRLGRRHLIRPRIGPSQQSGRVANREVGRGNLIEILPGNRK
jgi:hypothetical protein